MKLQEIKDFVKELRGLSQEELAKKDRVFSLTFHCFYGAGFHQIIPAALYPMV